MNLSTYAKITYALGEMYFKSGEKVDLADLKFASKIDPEMALKIVDLVNSMEGMQDLTAVLPGSTVETSPFSLEKPGPLSVPRLGSDQEDNAPEEESTRPR